MVNETLLFFFVRVEPNMVIGIGRMQSFDKRQRAWGEKILGGDEAGLGALLEVLDRMKELTVVWAGNKISPPKRVVQFFLKLEGGADQPILVESVLRWMVK